MMNSLEPMIGYSGGGLDSLAESKTTRGDRYRIGTGGGGYLAYAGPIAPAGRLAQALEIATRAGLPLKVAADRACFDNGGPPMLEHPAVDVVGQIDRIDKQDFLGDALALLLPDKGSAPSAQIMTAALACGTPVIGYRQDLIPGIIQHDKTGFIVDTVDAAVAVIECLPRLSRHACREAYASRLGVYG